MDGWVFFGKTYGNFDPSGEKQAPLAAHLGIPVGGGGERNDDKKGQGKILSDLKVRGKRVFLPFPHNGFANLIKVKGGVKCSNKKEPKKERVGGSLCPLSLGGKDLGRERGEVSCTITRIGSAAKLKNLRTILSRTWFIGGRERGKFNKS